MRNDGDEIATELLQASIRSDVADRVDDALARVDCGRREPLFVPTTRERQERRSYSLARTTHGNAVDQRLPLGYHLGDGAANGLACPDAENRLGGGVRDAHTPVVVDEEHPIVNVRER